MVKKKERSLSRPFKKEDHFYVNTSVGNLKKYKMSSKRKVSVCLMIARR